MDLSRLQLAEINGDVIRESISTSVHIARDEILTPGNIFKFGPFKRKKIYRETLEAYQQQFAVSFIFQLYLSITMPLNELYIMESFLRSLDLPILEESVSNEISVRTTSEIFSADQDTFYSKRMEVLSVYLKTLVRLGQQNVPIIAGSRDGAFFRIYANDIRAILHQ